MRVPFRQLADFADFLQAKNFKHMKNKGIPISLSLITDFSNFYHWLKGISRHMRPKFFYLCAD